jgi:ABC-type phosphonate transport system ATPase subunit
MKLCFRSDEPTGGLGHSTQGAVFGLLRPDTASRMLVTQLLVLGDLFVRALASDFVVLVLSEAVLSETVLVLDGCSNCGDADR